MGHELRNALRIAHRINALCASGRTRLWLPKLSSAWLGATPSSYALYEPSYLLSGEPQSGTNQPDSDLSSAEARQGLLENSHTAAAMRDRVDLYTTDLRPSLQDTLSFRRLPELIHSLWSSGPSMRIRFVGSWIVRSAQHSSHLKHALKNAGGVALLTLPAFLDTRAAGGPSIILRSTKHLEKISEHYPRQPVVRNFACPMDGTFHRLLYKPYLMIYEWIGNYIHMDTRNQYRRDLAFMLPTSGQLFNHRLPCGEVNRSYRLARFSELSTLISWVSFPRVLSRAF